MSVKIRRATEEDIPWLINELRQFAQFFGTKLSLLDEETAPLGLSRLILNHPFFVAEKESVGPVGFLSGLLSPHAFNPKITQLTEVFWWVSEEHRQSKAGLLLFQEYVAFGKANADWINCTLEVGSPVKDAFLERQGFRLQERSFILEVN